jgi:hypothetical protein
MFKLIAAFFFPAIIGTNPATALNQNAFTAANAMEFYGGIPNNGGLIGMIQALSTNGGPGAGVSNFQTSAAATITLTNLGALTQRLTNGGAVTVTLDNAPNIVASIAGPTNGMRFPMVIITNAGTTVATPTVTNTGVTLAGTTTVLAAAARWYEGQITQLTTQTVTGVTAGTTFTSIAQIGSTNLYTLTLGTNAVTSVVGNLIYLGVTAGNLPPGFYPTYTAGTTTIVIALPTSGTVWTATAATMVAPTVVPVTYAPLITLTGVMATVTATMSV